MQSEEKIIIAALGPTVNIAKLLLAHPDCKEKIRCIFSMMGSIDGKGNISKYAEFNAYHDPVAMDVILKSGVPFIMSPLHLGLKTAVANKKFYSHRRKTFKEDFIYQLIKGSYEPLQEGYFAIHDAHVIYGLLNPKLYEFKRCNISISLNLETYAQTTVEFNPEGKHYVQLAKNHKRLSRKMFKDFYRG